MTAAQPPAQSTADAAADRRRLWVNWALALLTVVGAGIAMAVALGAVMSTAACSDKACPNLGPHGISFDVLFYGAPARRGGDGRRSRSSPRGADGVS